ncbi:hypothetical protein ACFPRL_10125 [Pseudoclavibacter helvolus]
MQPGGPDLAGRAAAQRGTKPWPGRGSQGPHGADSGRTGGRRRPAGAPRAHPESAAARVCPARPALRVERTRSGGERIACGGVARPSQRGSVLARVARWKRPLFGPAGRE